VAEEMSGDLLVRMPVTIRPEEFIMCQNDIPGENHQIKFGEHL
jgi:hypothetical protein